MMHFVWLLQMQQGLWDPAICLNFFDKFLTWLKTCVALQDNPRWAWLVNCNVESQFLTEWPIWWSTQIHPIRSQLRNHLIMILKFYLTGTLTKIPLLDISNIIIVFLYMKNSNRLYYNIVTIKGLIRLEINWSNWCGH